MAQIKKSKKGLIIAICAVLVVAIVVVSVVVVQANSAKTQVTLTDISTGSIDEVVEGTGTISAGAEKSYKTQLVATVKEVLVQVGDHVKAGDVLATFDTSALDEQIRSLSASYDSAKASYDSAVQSQQTAEKNLKATESQISTLEAEKDRLENAVANTDVGALVSGAVSGVMADVSDSLSKLISDSSTVSQILSVVSEELARQIAAGNTDAESITQAIVQAVQKALPNLDLDADSLTDAILQAVADVDWNGMVQQVTQSDAAQLASAEVQLAALYAQKEIYKAQSGDTLVSAQKSVVDTAASALESVQAQADSMSAGWTAAFDGVITACDLVAGQQTTLMSQGITLQNTDSLTVTISLGKYDALKVKEGMPASVNNGQYEGVVSFVSPTASGGDTSGLLDSVGSMAGISGLSSLGASGAGVECQVTVTNPDDALIIGFDTDVTISVGNHENIVVIPIESLVLEKTGSYVWVYNEEDSTISKVQIETGATSDTQYEVTDGLQAGDQIVSAPSALNLAEDETENIKVKVVDKLSDEA